MQVIGARFLSLHVANVALQALRAAVAVAPGDAAVRPLGSTRYDAPVDGYVLGGRFEDADADEVSNILERHGGVVIERRPELPPSAVRPGSTVASNPPWTAQWTPARQQLRPAKPKAASRLRKRLRRPVAPLRARAARAHRSAEDCQ